MPSISLFYYKFAKQYGISDIALFTLNIIYNSKECIQNNLAEKLALPKQTVCSILDNFEKKGYVKREINPKDKRNRLISLTKKGIEFAKPIIEGLENLDINMLKCLSDEDI
ncbi:MAG: MarR family transcriptional regulator, partial [Brachyspira sp.]|nr:MarR family transcriptional regulator [Brachyspira sp.]